MRSMKRFSALCLSLCVLMSVGVAKASTDETTQDLFKVYNEKEAQETEELYNNYTALKEQYEEVQSDITSKEIYNVVYEEALKYQNENLAKLNNEITDLMNENSGIADNISNSLSNDNWEQLITQDKQYKINIDEINRLLDKRQEYNLIDKKDISYEELEAIEKELKETSDKYKLEGPNIVLGEVTNVRWPLNEDTCVTSNFGDRVDPISGDRIQFHSGVDLRASIGTEVVAAFNGVVVATGFGPLGGNYVTIEHGNGVRTYFCHLSEILCEEGQEVSQYDVVALSGNTGSRTTGPHLHFSLYINGNPVDPEVLFSTQE